MTRTGFACLLMLCCFGAAIADESSQNATASQASGEAAQADDDSAKLGLPDIDAEGLMALPDGYREWVFVGSSLGLGYDAERTPKNPMFRHVYINPIGYQTYRDTGKFPIGTVLMLESVARGSKVNPALTGDFGERFAGLEAAVKTGDRFDDPWVYYSFSRTDRKPGTRASRLTTKVCIDCHREHAAVDHVFTQFYPVLRVLHETPAEHESETP